MSRLLLSVDSIRTNAGTGNLLAVFGTGSGRGF